MLLNCKSKLLTWIFIALVDLILFQEISCIRISEFHIPPILSTGDSAKFICKYELNGDRLYSLKWYKNETEFYRYEPNSYQNRIQIFPIPEIPLEVSKSYDGTTLVVSNVIPETSGKYKCELSADGSFLTVQREQELIVTDRSVCLQTSSSSNIVFYIIWLMVTANGRYL